MKCNFYCYNIPNLNYQFVAKENTAIINIYTNFTINKWKWFMEVPYNIIKYIINRRGIYKTAKL